MLKESHGQAEDYHIKSELILLAFHIHVARGEKADDVLDLLIDFLHSSSRSQFRQEMKHEGSHIQILFSDLALYAPAESAHDTSPELLSQVLRQLRWLLVDDDYLFDVFDKDARMMKTTHLLGVLATVNERLGR